MTPEALPQPPPACLQARPPALLVLVDRPSSAAGNPSPWTCDWRDQFKIKWTSTKNKNGGQSCLSHWVENASKTGGVFTKKQIFYFFFTFRGWMTIKWTGIETRNKEFNASTSVLLLKQGTWIQTLDMNVAISNQKLTFWGAGGSPWKCRVAPWPGPLSIKYTRGRSPQSIIILTSKCTHGSFRKQESKVHITPGMLCMELPSTIMQEGASPVSYLTAKGPFVIHGSVPHWPQESNRCRVAALQKLSNNISAPTQL